MKKLLPIALTAIFLPWQVAHASPSTSGTPTVTLSSPVVPPGGSITVNGSNFPATANCTVTVNTQPLGVSASPQTGSDGSFSVSIPTASTTTPGTYSVTATCGGTSAQPVALRVATPQVVFSPSTISPGSTVSISGSGFAGNTPLTISVTINVAGGGTSPFTQSIQTTTEGTFAGVTINVPGTAVNGSYPIQFSQSGATVLTTSLTVGQATTLSLTPASVSTGTYSPLTASATNFLVGEKVDVTYTAKMSDGTTQVINASGTADGAGNVTHVILYVPQNTSPGVYTVTATGENSHRVATAQLIVTPAASLTITPSSLPAGGTVTAAGQNFAPGLLVTLTAQASQKDGSVQNVVVTANADAGGAFSVAVPIPAGTVPGPVHFSATAPGPNNTQIVANATVTVSALHPSLQVTPAPVSPGSVVGVTASGFLAGASVTVSTQVTVNGALQTLSQTVPADSSGVAEAFLALPQGASSGSSTVTAAQPASSATATATLTIQTPSPTATPTASPTPSPTPTSTATATPTPSPRLGFQYVRTLHHVSRPGQMNQLDAQASVGQALTIWVHVNFPTGRHIDYISTTDGKGHWTKQFRVPAHATNRYSTRVYVHYQLWRGKETAKTFGSFLIKE